ncbi:MAG: hypothetical protein KME35_12420 [Aphanocapsa sp. GSE-SYN-MK-11-07L]|nr:hypothetical protein [Aphanocapsa sp. GSE-SYN-MK-11-07L]
MKRRVSTQSKSNLPRLRRSLDDQNWFRTSLVFALIGCLGLGAGCRQSASQPDSAAKAAESNPEKTVGNFVAIENTNFLVAPIQEKLDRERTSFSLDISSRGYNSADVYNYVFFDRQSQSVQRLIPTNEFVILQQQGLPERAIVPPSKSLLPLAWFLYSIIKTDTNQDQKLALGDRLTLAVSDVGGRGYTELISDVDQLLAATLRDSATLVVIYRSQAGLSIAQINLPQRRLLKTTPIPSLGSEVK